MTQQFQQAAVFGFAGNNDDAGFAAFEQPGFRIEEQFACSSPALRASAE